MFSTAKGILNLECLNLFKSCVSSLNNKCVPCGPGCERGEGGPGRCSTTVCCQWTACPGHERLLQSSLNGKKRNQGLLSVLISSFQHFFPPLLFGPTVSPSK